MNKTSLRKVSTRFWPKQALLFLLLSVFLLSFCPVKKTIQFFLLRDNAVENNSSALNKPGAPAKAHATDYSKLCTVSSVPVFDAPDLKIIQASQLISTLSLIFLGFLSGLSFALQALYHKSRLFYFSRSALFLADTPLYIKNRLLLI